VASWRALSTALRIVSTAMPVPIFTRSVIAAT
jgi:hypothetical protein